MRKLFQFHNQSIKNFQNLSRICTANLSFLWGHVTLFHSDHRYQFEGLDFSSGQQTFHADLVYDNC